MQREPIIRLDSSLPASRWQFAPSRPLLRLRCDAGTMRTTLSDSRGVRLDWDNPLQALDWMSRFEQFPAQRGRWIGFISYDFGRLFESIPCSARDDLGAPLFAFTYHAPADQPAAYQIAPQPFRQINSKSNFSRAQYESAVRRSMEYIAAGDIFQVNLSQRFTTGLNSSAAGIYQRLLSRSPAWFGALLEYPDLALICNSPETFLKVTPLPDGRRRVLTRPIKGTRPRGPGMDGELANSLKDQAELNMIVDLERNDLGRVCEIGSVAVTQPRAIEAHPTVYHGVATIEGVLRMDVGLVDLLRATFPGGSVTGAPKIRAMQIIDELEPTRRGPYCGTIGYLDADGSMEFNVAIRTMIVREGLVHVPVGGGIVADSDPAEEYDETLVKARAMFAALGLSAVDFNASTA